MTSTPFAHHPDVRESIRLTIARAQTLGPSLDLRRQALTLLSMPWIIMAPNSSTSYKDWATYKLEEYRERNAECAATMDVLGSPCYGSGLTRHKKDEEMAGKLVTMLAENLDNWSTGGIFRHPAREYIWYIVGLPGGFHSSITSWPEAVKLRKNLNEIYAPELERNMRILWQHRLWDLFASYYGRVDDLTHFDNASRDKIDFPRQSDKLRPYLRDEKYKLSVVWTTGLDDWVGVMDALTLELQARQNSVKQPSQPTQFSPNSCCSHRYQASLLVDCGRHQDGRRWSMAVNNIALAALYILHLVETPTEADDGDLDGSYWEVLKRLPCHPHNAHEPTDTIRIESNVLKYTTGQVQRPAIMALLISPIVLLCDATCSYENQCTFLDLTTVHQYIGHNEPPRRIYHLERRIWMAVFAVVFGGDPEDELVSLLQDWDKIRGLDGGDNDSDGNWFREMCGTPSTPATDLVESSAMGTPSDIGASPFSNQPSGSETHPVKSLTGTRTSGVVDHHRPDRSSLRHPAGDGRSSVSSPRSAVKPTENSILWAIPISSSQPAPFSSSSAQTRPLPVATYPTDHNEALRSHSSCAPGTEGQSSPPRLIELYKNQVVQFIKNITSENEVIRRESARKDDEIGRLGRSNLELVRERHELFEKSERLQFERDLMQENMESARIESKVSKNQKEGLAVRCGRLEQDHRTLKTTIAKVERDNAKLVEDRELLQVEVAESSFQKGELVEALKRSTDSLGEGGSRAGNEPLGRQNATLLEQIADFRFELEAIRKERDKSQMLCESLRKRNDESQSELKRLQVLNKRYKNDRDGLWESTKQIQETVGVLKAERVGMLAELTMWRDREPTTTSSWWNSQLPDLESKPDSGLGSSSPISTSTRSKI